MKARRAEGVAATGDVRAAISLAKVSRMLQRDLSSLPDARLAVLESERRRSSAYPLPDGLGRCSPELGR